jgi:nucleoside-diphosphate-sugar epimerase
MSPLLVTSYVVEHISQSFTMDTSKARALLGYTPEQEYPEGFVEVYNWLTSTGDIAFQRR